ncbi:Acetylglutamate kinase, chloroplastic [Apostasia shenzhenica]|uniref:acetylglutamate kinase n=1 Tax=Apostasia shenzhenica TaxID=1088818 RepID=A0A2I0B8L9_9ASPA|nr:Acetylglutamate kinase, chloroplastic [Apostasia shenzhenica]
MLTAKPSEVLHPPSRTFKTLSIPNPNPSFDAIPFLRFRRRRCAPLATAASDSLAAVANAAQSRVDILSESLPFIQRFRGKTIVVKYGGAAMKSPALQSSVINDLVLLACVGLRPVLVHGGGPEINSWLLRLGVQPQFHNGLRVTDALTMEVVEMVLVGKVNKSLVSLINLAGGTAIGLCGKDGRLLTARPSPDSASLGFVGEVSRVNPAILRPIIADNHIPVIASVAADDEGQGYNVNADTAAGEIAAAVGAEKLILLTDVAGILEDCNDPGSLVKEIHISGVRRMVEEGKVAGGMIPKVNCCVRSLAQGVRTASIIDGRVAHSLLLEILTDEGAGTMITG